MSFAGKSIGKIGEDFAANYLQKQGYTILHRNYSTRYGELDIIAKKGNKISFIEVKTRSNLLKGKPYEAVTYYKIKHLRSAAEIYLLKNKIKDCKLSLDNISILLNTDNSIKEIFLYENIIS